MKKTIRIEGMHCPHCSARVEKALAGLGMKNISVDLAAKCAYAEGDASIKQITDEIEDLGFEVISVL